MNERPKMKIKIITAKGFKYQGKFISENSVLIELEDEKEGRLKIPYSNISLIKTLKEVTR